MIEDAATRVVIDVGPDFRYQMLRAGVRHLDGVILTHEHKDHVGGIDDLRPLNFVDYPEAIYNIPIYAAAKTLATVKKDYDYAFATDKYRGVPEISTVEIDSAPFKIGTLEFLPIKGHHSPRFEVRGFRVGALAYLTDFKSLDEGEVEKLSGLDVLIVNGLRHEPHPSHFTIAEALSLAREVQPKRCYLTHASHDVGLHVEVNAILPEGVEFAYDMLEIEF